MTETSKTPLSKNGKSNIKTSQQSLDEHLRLQQKQIKSDQEILEKLNDFIKELNKQADMSDSLCFNTENIFDYLKILISQNELDIFGDEALQIVSEIITYIESLPLADTFPASFEIESKVMDALSSTSNHAYRAGFIDACKLQNTLRSF